MVCLFGFNAAFNNLSVISRRNREDDFGYPHMLQNTSYGSKTTPPAKGLELLGIQEYGPPYPGGSRWLHPGPTLGPLSQPLEALFKGEHEKTFEEKERKIQRDPGTRPQRLAKNTPSFFNVPGV